MDELRMHQLTKEMVAEELRLMGDPCKTAAEVVRRTLTAALQSPPDGTAPERIIEDSVKGAMTAVLLADQNLTRAAMLVLAAVMDASNATVEPSAAMGAALKGVADLRRFTDPQRLEEIRLEIAAQYMGAGEVFVEYLRAPIPGDQTPAPR
ncbi:MAG: hypothetical protein ACHQ51_01250 [Elusimicrobiota bacterium]